MSSSTYACHEDTVEIDFVKKQCPYEWEEFNFALADGDVSFDCFCLLQSGLDDLERMTDEDKAEAINKAYDALCEVFNKTTGLELGVVHHEADDRADDLDGGAFSVDGVYQLTPAGKKYEDSIVRKFWTTSG